MYCHIRLFNCVTIIFLLNLSRRLCRVTQYHACNKYTATECGNNSAGLLCHINQIIQICPDKRLKFNLALHAYSTPDFDRTCIADFYVKTHVNSIAHIMSVLNYNKRYKKVQPSSENSKILNGDICEELLNILGCTGLGTFITSEHLLTYCAKSYTNKCLKDTLLFYKSNVAYYNIRAYHLCQESLHKSSLRSFSTENTPEPTIQTNFLDSSGFSSINITQEPTTQTIVLDSSGSSSIHITQKPTTQNNFLDLSDSSSIHITQKPTTQNNFLDSSTIEKKETDKTEQNFSSFMPTVITTTSENKCEYFDLDDCKDNEQGLNCFLVKTYQKNNNNKSDVLKLLCTSNYVKLTENTQRNNRISDFCQAFQLKKIIGRLTTQNTENYFYDVTLEPTYKEFNFYDHTFSCENVIDAFGCTLNESALDLKDIFSYCPNTYFRICQDNLFTKMKNEPENDSLSTHQSIDYVSLKMYNACTSIIDKQTTDFSESSKHINLTYPNNYDFTETAEDVIYSTKQIETTTTDIIADHESSRNTDKTREASNSVSYFTNMNIIESKTSEQDIQESDTMTSFSKQIDTEDDKWKLASTMLTITTAASTSTNDKLISSSSTQLENSSKKQVDLSIEKIDKLLFKRLSTTKKDREQHYTDFHLNLSRPVQLLKDMLKQVRIVLNITHINDGTICPVKQPEHHYCFLNYLLKSGKLISESHFFGLSLFLAHPNLRWPFFYLYGGLLGDAVMSSLRSYTDKKLLINAAFLFEDIFTSFIVKRQREEGIPTDIITTESLRKGYKSRIVYTSYLLMFVNLEKTALTRLQLIKNLQEMFTPSTKMSSSMTQCSMDDDQNKRQARHEVYKDLGNGLMQTVQRTNVKLVGSIMIEPTMRALFDYHNMSKLFGNRTFSSKKRALITPIRLPAMGGPSANMVNLFLARFEQMLAANQIYGPWRDLYVYYANDFHADRPLEKIPQYSNYFPGEAEDAVMELNENIFRLDISLSNLNGRSLTEAEAIPMEDIEPLDIMNEEFADLLDVEDLLDLVDPEGLQELDNIMEELFNEVQQDLADRGEVYQPSPEPSAEPSPGGSSSSPEHMDFSDAASEAGSDTSLLRPSSSGTESGFSGGTGGAGTGVTGGASWLSRFASSLPRVPQGILSTASGFLGSFGSFFAGLGGVLSMCGEMFGALSIGLGIVTILTVLIAATLSTLFPSHEITTTSTSTAKKQLPEALRTTEITPNVTHERTYEYSTVSSSVELNITNNTSMTTTQSLEFFSEEYEIPETNITSEAGSTNQINETTEKTNFIQSSGAEPSVQFVYIPFETAFISIKKRSVKPSLHK